MLSFKQLLFATPLLGILVALDTAATAPRLQDDDTRTRNPGGDGSSEESKTPLRQRLAHIGVSRDEPESLYTLVGAIESAFGLRISIEPLPEHCAGTATAEKPPEPFAVYKGERFGEAISRLESASAGRWIFEEIHGVPLLRPEEAFEGHGTLLDTSVTVDIEAASVWKALCALASAVNHANEVHAGKARPLLIMIAGPDILRRPPSFLIEETAISIELNDVTAREGLCAILATVDKHFRYLYHCVGEHSDSTYEYVTISAFDNDNQVIDGGRLRREEIVQPDESVEWLDFKTILAVQAPGLEKAIE